MMPQPTMQERVYGILYGGVQFGNSHAEIAAYLRAEGHGTLTICPACRRADFKHNAGCQFVKWFDSGLKTLLDATKVGLGTKAVDYFSAK